MTTLAEVIAQIEAEGPAVLKHSGFFVIDELQGPHPLIVTTKSMQKWCRYEKLSEIYARHCDHDGLDIDSFFYKIVRPGDEDWPYYVVEIMYNGAWERCYGQTNGRNLEKCQDYIAWAEDGDRTTEKSQSQRRIVDSVTGKVVE